MSPCAGRRCGSSWHFEPFRGAATGPRIRSRKRFAGGRSVADRDVRATLEDQDPRASPQPLDRAGRLFPRGRDTSQQRPPRKPSALKVQSELNPRAFGPGEGWMLRPNHSRFANKAGMAHASRRFGCGSARLGTCAYREPLSIATNPSLGAGSLTGLPSSGLRRRRKGDAGRPAWCCVDRRRRSRPLGPSSVRWSLSPCD